MMKVKSMISLLLCSCLTVISVIGSSQTVLTVQAAEITKLKTEENNQEKVIPVQESDADSEEKGANGKPVIEEENNEPEEENLKETDDITGEAEAVSKNAMISLYSESGSIILNETNFPDSVFRNYVSEVFDIDGDGELSVSERATVICINVAYEEIEDLHGIEFFDNLESLSCGFNNLTSLDVSQNIALERLSCSDNNLTNLDVSQNTALKELSCSNNNLTSLDVNQNLVLERLYCSDNNLTRLDISRNLAMYELSCSDNNLTSLDVSNNTFLGELNCCGNKLPFIDISNNTLLNNPLYDYQFSNFYGNIYSIPDTCIDVSAIEGFDINKTSDWENAEIDGTIITFINPRYDITYQYQIKEGETETFTFRSEIADPDLVPGAIAINETNFPDEIFRSDVSWRFDDNNDDVLSESERNAVTRVGVSGGMNDYYNIISIQGIEFFPNLKELNCSSLPKLISVDVSKNEELEVIDITDCPITSLDISQNTKLTDLTCNNTALTSLDVSKNAALGVLKCDNNNNLMSLDVSKNTALRLLYCNSNALTKLNISGAAALEYLQCTNNALTNLDVSKNAALYYLQCENNVLTELNVSGTTALKSLYCAGNDLTSLDVSNNAVLSNLDCSRNVLTSLDVSKNPKLVYLVCANNKLNNLNADGATELLSLECGYNDLVKLDVTNNKELAWIECRNNRLTSLTGVENLTELSGLDLSNNLLSTLPDMRSLTSLTNGYNNLRIEWTPFARFQYNYLSENELRSKLPDQLLADTTWLQEQIDNQYNVSKPSTLTLSVSNASSMKIAWTKAADVSGYEIWYATSQNGTYKNAKTTTETSYTQSGLKAGTTYYYKIRSYKTVSGEKVYSDYTSPKSKKLTVPTPTSVKLANSSANSLKISWKKVSGASGYEIYRATSKSGTYKKIKTVTSGTTVTATDKSLTNGKNYYYKVRAYRTVDGSKKYSGFCSVISKKVTLPKTTLTATAKSKTSIKLSWKKVAGATKYEVYRATSKNGTYKKVKTTTSLTFINTSLKSNKTYYYKVKAVQVISKKTYKSAYSTVQYEKTKK